MCVVNLPVEKHIVSDQIAQLEGLCTVVELTAENVSRILEEAAEFIYSSAEQVLENMCEWVFLHRYRRGQGSNPGKPDFFRLSFRNCISFVNNCEDLLYIYLKVMCRC